MGHWPKWYPRSIAPAGMQQAKACTEPNMPPRCQRTSLSQPRPLGGPVARSHSHSFSRMGSPASGCSVDCSHGCTALEPSQICTAKSDLHPSLQASGAEQHRSWWRHERRRERALPAAAHRRPPAEPARCCRCKFRARWSGAGCARAEYRQARWRRPAGGTAPAARSSILVACGQRVQGRLQRPAPPQGSCSSSAGTEGSTWLQIRAQQWLGALGRPLQSQPGSQAPKCR